MLCRRDELDDARRAVFFSKLLRAEDPNERVQGLKQVVDSSLGDLAQPVVELLADHHSDVRYEATQALGRLLAGSGRAPAALRRCLEDRDELVRIAAIEAAGDIGDKRIASLLRRRTNDSSPVVRSYAASALGSLGVQGARGALITASRRERSARARVGVYEGLFRLGEQWALDRLLALLRSKQYRVRCAVGNTVAELPLEPESRGEVRRALKTALAAEHTVAATSSLRFALRRVRRQGA
jgi:HEAT repeat protein